MPAYSLTGGNTQTESIPVAHCAWVAPAVSQDGQKPARGQRTETPRVPKCPELFQLIPGQCRAGLPQEKAISTFHPQTGSTTIKNITAHDKYRDTFHSCETDTKRFGEKTLSNNVVRSSIIPRLGRRCTSAATFIFSPPCIREDTFKRSFRLPDDGDSRRVHSVDEGVSPHAHIFFLASREPS